MEIKEFVDNYREAFGQGAELPVLFWYSDTPLTETYPIKRCFFKCFGRVRNGTPVSLNAETIGCGGGKFYTGFAEMNPYIPHFVSVTERYKQTPESVRGFIEGLQVRRAEKKFLNFCRMDKAESLEQAEGIVFFTTPDMLSGLTTWAWYDNHSDDAVTTMFGSGCSVLITQTINENERAGRRVFLGGFDPSVRPYLKANELIFTIPMGRFKEMLGTMKESCLYGTKAWATLRKRIVSGQNRT